MFKTAVRYRILRIELNNSMTHYILYQITNLINGKIYVGVHSTETLNDGYMGSGKQIKAAIEKYGIANFRRDILATFDTPEMMWDSEAKLVNEEFVARRDTYNMKTGGIGSWSHISKENNRVNSSKGGKTRGQQASNWFKDPQWQAVGNAMKNPEFVKEQVKRANSPEAMAKKKETWKRIGRGKAEKNSQYGSKWITNGIESKKIKIDDTIPDGWRSGRVVKTA